MPTYEYKCEECGHQFEVFARMSDPDPQDCETCGAKGSLVKVLFPVAVHYKGSGFYSTDYSGKGGSAGGAGTGAGAPSGGSSEGSGADSAGSSGDSSSSSGGDSGSTSTASTGSGSGSAPAKPSTSSES